MTVMEAQLGEPVLGTQIWATNVAVLFSPPSHIPSQQR